ncbi:sensor histidine kinase [Thermoactinomyces mirandus]|uniref:histidine kinase n=1 Tax=Thermoactinomyces mirandus TaxID=2756294 RepID=A0A7W2AQN7_9BACL|nr:sensor histidine kinase [Thermoactinomyces mirandus]MBA4602149.1 sensor histidine kinase [Thermoactinomyces mirandus]
MFALVPFMFEKVGIIFILAFLLSQMKSFRQLVQNEHKMNEKIMLILLFGVFGIISNYTGIEIYQYTINTHEWNSELNPESALANTRVMGVVIGGLVGGPLVGFGAGMIAGIHRLLLGGFTAFSCAFSTFVAGIVSGYLGRKRIMKERKLTPLYAVLTGITLETIQMLIILALSKPFEQSWNLVRIIGFPMIFVNGFGTLLFMLIIRSIMSDTERTRANQTNLAYKIADQTLPFFRQGLNARSCKAVSEIMLKLTSADAVAVTNNCKVLAHVGAASDHHIPMKKPVTGLTKKVLKTGEISIATSKEEIFCMNSHCPLKAAIVLPLKVHAKTVGTLKMYYTKADKLDKVEVQLAEGLANLFSTQLELAEAERQTKLLKDAKIKALQAQIHPHFLFNCLNTISVLCRTDPDKARKLLLKLSSFFRGNLQGARQKLISLGKELENVKSYLSLVQTRFPDKYLISFKIEPHLENVLIPPFLLQPIVENAINYGFPGSKYGGKITVHVFSKNGQLHIHVEDDGKGIPLEKVRDLGKKVVVSAKGNGTALYNISERLKGIYGCQASLTIKSEENVGTLVAISIPLDSKGVFEHEAESVYSG